MVLQKVYDNDKDFLSKVLGGLSPDRGRRENSNPMDIFFIDTLIVTPNKFRPVSICGILILNKFCTCGNYLHFLNFFYF